MDIERESQPQMGRKTTKHSHIGIELSVFKRSDGLILHTQHIRKLLDSQTMLYSIADDRMRHLAAKRGSLPLRAECGIIAFVPFDKLIDRDAVRVEPLVDDGLSKESSRCCAIAIARRNARGSCTASGLTAAITNTSARTRLYSALHWERPQRGRNSRSAVPFT